MQELKKQMVFIWPDLKALYVVSISINLFHQMWDSHPVQTCQILQTKSYRFAYECLPYEPSPIYKFLTNSWEAISPFSGDVQQPDRRREPCFSGGSQYEPTKSVSLAAFQWQNSSSWCVSTPWKILCSQIGNLPQMDVSVNGGTPQSPPQVLIILSRKTPWLLGKPTIHCRKPPK